MKRFHAQAAFAFAIVAMAALAGCSGGGGGSPSGTTDSDGKAKPFWVDGTAKFEMKVLTSGLRGPWEITWGPDNFLWVTERIGGRIDRIDPADGKVTPLIQIKEVSAPGGQDGLLGLALHPDLLKGTGNDYVYTAYTYVDEARGADETVTQASSPYRFLYTKIVRLTYDQATNTLKDPVELIAGLPASNDHNSGRMKIGPDGKLYYTIGDGGNDQLGNWCIPIQAQRLPTEDELAAKNYFAYQGKSLRLNLDGSIPDDNPVIKGVKSHIFTYGHRNMQGIDFGPDGTLYASEQGPKTDDEINILQSGGNFGWPHVVGFRDDMAYQYARWKDSTVPCEYLLFSDIIIADSVPVEKETSWTEEMVSPIATMFTVPSDWNFTDDRCKGVHFVCWPTVATSSIEAYRPKSGGIPGWENSLLVTTLKRGSVYRIPLSADGKTVAGPMERYFATRNRYRDTAVSPDLKTIYVATDPGGLTELAENGEIVGTTTTVRNMGDILAFTYVGDGAATTTAPAASTETPADAPAATTAAATTPVMFTAAQAGRGKVAYEANCVTCHGVNMVDTAYGTPLAGPYFDDKWRGKTVLEFFQYAHDKMPPSRPGALTDQEYADITAYVLQVNGVAAGDVELPTDAEQLKLMAIPAK